ncbi:MAG: serine/threonine-protein kinase [Polyangiaceae bacterium]
MEPRAASTASAGRVIAGRYKLVELIGNGSMGVVWKAEHLGLGASVALKLIHSDGRFHALSEELQRRFVREARAIAAVRGPHVVQILDHGVDDGLPYIVLELLQGESLDARLERVSRLSLEETRRYVTHVARALSRAREAGYIHRDLKPSNVFLVESDGETIAKVLDFGLAKALHSEDAEEASQLTEIGRIVGTPMYMSPEQIRGKQVDHRTDLWSLAVIAYECVCGGLPFEGETLQDVMISACTEDPILPSSFDHVLAPHFDEWFARCVQRNPDKRFQSAQEFVAALSRVECAEPADLPIVGVRRSSRTSIPVRSAAETAPKLSSAGVSIYESTVNLEELSGFWETASHERAPDAEKVALKLTDRVYVKSGDGEAGPILVLEIVQAVRDRNLTGAASARRVGSDEWLPLTSIRVVGENGRALDLAELLGSPPNVAAVPKLLPAISPGLGSPVIREAAAAPKEATPLGDAMIEKRSEGRYRWALVAVVVALLVALIVARAVAG